MGTGHQILNPLLPLAGDSLRRFHEGDRGVFRTVVERLSPRLLARAFSFAADADEAHDLVQETWKRVFERRQTYTGRGTLAGWIITIHRSVCLNHAAARKAEAGRPAMGTIGDASGSPGDVVEGTILGEALREAIDQLPERERDVLYLRFLAQQSTRETAQALGCAEGTVKATVHHAMKKMRTLMKEWAL